MQHSELPSFTLYLLQWAISALALFLTAKIVPGFRIKGFFSAMIGAFAIGLANIFIRPVLVVLTLPISIVTLGLFLLVVNGAVLRICAALLPGFEIRGWIPAIFGWIVLTFLNFTLHYYLL